MNTKKQTLYDIFGTDKALEKEGIFLDYDFGGVKFKIKIARAGGANTKYNERMRILAKPYMHRIQNGMMDEETSNKIQIQAYADAVVLGWDGVTDPEGNPLPFSRENVVTLFTEAPDLFKDVVEQASSFQLFKKAEQEEATKNS